MVTLREIGIALTTRLKMLSGAQSALLAALGLLAAGVYAEDIVFHRVLLLAAMVCQGCGLMLSIRSQLAIGPRARDPASPPHDSATDRSTLDRLVAGSPALLYLGRVTPDGSYERLYATRNAQTVTGWTDAEMDNPDRVWSHVWSQDAALRNTNFQRAVRLGRSIAEFRYHRPDGSVIWLRNEVVRIALFADGSAEVAGAVTNISRERELAAMADIHSRMATLGELATGLAHELTQPVTVIGMAAELARDMARDAFHDHRGDGRAQDGLQRQLEQVLGQVGRATEIISHLRLYGHADGGALGAVDLRRAVDGAMTLASAPLHRAGVQVHVNLAASLPSVQARSIQVEQVLLNLFLNARDAMSSRPSDVRHITISAQFDEDDPTSPLLLHVADTGPGIARDILPRLFDAFFTTKAPGDGTGLGLSISRTLMRGFGGDISAVSTPGGATFTLLFERA